MYILNVELTVTYKLKHILATLWVRVISLYAITKNQTLQILVDKNLQSKTLKVTGIRIV